MTRGICILVALCLGHVAVVRAQEFIVPKVHPDSRPLPGAERMAEPVQRGPVRRHRSARDLVVPGRCVVCHGGPIPMDQNAVRRLHDRPRIQELAGCQ